MSQETENDFSKARNKALINELQHILNPEEASMISFKQIRQIIKPQNETYVGMQTIPISKIVGSEGRYKDFDNQFFPKNSFMKERWEHVDEAVIKDIILPPIRVYELGGLYFVRDGSVQYSGHIQNKGWDVWRQNGAVSGTADGTKRFEAVMMQR